jgi:hypothetical protein
MIKIYVHKIKIEGIPMLLPVPLLAVGRHKHILLLEQLAQRAILVHRHEDVRATNELAANVQLGDRLPIAVLLDACSSVVSKMFPSAPIMQFSGYPTYLT